MLHIHNGDASANIAKQTSLPGEHFAFREALVDGPTPAGSSASDWRLMRARHLWETYGVDLNECSQELLAQEMKLASFEQHDEVVLWFEHDLFCQVHLIYLLDWFGKQQLGDTKLSLVCIDTFPGKENFRGLGELASDELASLFPARQAVSKAQVNLAISAWSAYCSENPMEIQRVTKGDTSSLPFLCAALEAHLGRFPATRNGLGRIESTLLRFLDAGPARFTDLFTQFGEAEPTYGFGDAQIWVALRRMNRARHPLVVAKDSETLGKSIVPDVDLEITETGKSVLGGETDFIRLNPDEFWLGGVQFSKGQQVWRWDDENKRLLMG